MVYLGTKYLVPADYLLIPCPKCWELCPSIVIKDREILLDLTGIRAPSARGLDKAEEHRCDG
jgi:hypothetical protein